MKKPEEYLKDAHFKSLDVLMGICSPDGYEGSLEDRILNTIKQAQIDAIEETVKLCAENAESIIEYHAGNYGSPSSSVDRDSILNCAEILKKEL